MMILHLSTAALIRHWFYGILCLILARTYLSFIKISVLSNQHSFREPYETIGQVPRIDLTMSQKPSPQEYGFTAVPRDLDKLLEKADPERDPPKQLSTTEILSKFDKLTEKIHKYAREQLPELTYNHSMRVICFGKLGLCSLVLLLFLNGKRFEMLSN